MGAWGWMARQLLEKQDNSGCFGLSKSAAKHIARCLHKKAPTLTSRGFFIMAFMCDALEGSVSSIIYGRRRRAVCGDDVCIAQA